MTKLYLSSLDARLFRYIKTSDIEKSRYVLFTYFYGRDWLNDLRFVEVMKYFNDRHRLIIDSGVFSMMNSAKMSEAEVDDYCKDYGKFVKKYNIHYFVELDVDAVLGYKKALTYRKYLESKAGHRCIPIWHKSRGKAEFVKMCNNYDYAGIGGIAIGKIHRNEWKYFKQINKFAYSRHCKLHAMGFTPSHDANKFGFYSSDSSSWGTGTRFGSIFYFDGQRMKRYEKPKHARVINDYRKIHTHNWLEWCKYQKFVDR